MRSLDKAGGVVAAAALSFGMSGCASEEQPPIAIDKPTEATEPSRSSWFSMDTQHQLTDEVVGFIADDELQYVRNLPAYNTTPTDGIHSILLSLEPESSQQCIGEFSVNAVYNAEPTEWKFAIGLHGERQNFTLENVYTDYLLHGEGLPQELANGKIIDTEQPRKSQNTLRTYAKSVLWLLCR